ncbi:MAG: peptide deformylase, partial [Proteobacteria bacterium]|nr:peptide deformylase [Pseudomonadota bacterium]
FHAVVVQHEFDHLDGMLYPRRMTDLSTLVFDSEMRWFMEPQDASGESEEETAR